MSQSLLIAESLQCFSTIIIAGIGGLAKARHGLSIVPPDRLERLHGGRADTAISIAEYSDQRRHGFGRCRPHLPESLDGGPANIPISIAEYSDQRRHGFGRCRPDV